MRNANLGGQLASWLLICLLGWGLIPGPVQAQKKSKKPPYWFYHMTPVSYDLDSAAVELPLLDSVVGGYQFFFMGEEHWKTINTQLQLSFLLYLHQKAQVRNLIVEGGYSFGFLLDQYLQTGDEGILRKALTNIPVCPEDQMAMYERLYQYNRQLPEEARIHVTGIDVEHSPELALQVLHTLRSADQQPPQKIEKYIQRIADLHESHTIVRSDVKRFFRRFSRSLNRHEAAHRAYWGKDFGRIRLLADNTMAGYRFSVLKAMIFQRTWQKREARMYENFLQLQPYMADGGYFAQFGVLHTDLYQSSQWDFPTLAQRLNRLQGSPVTDQVLTISRYVRRMDERYDDLAQGEPVRRMVRHAERRFPGQVVLCSLIGNESPFPQLSRNFQYLLLIDENLESSSCD